MAGTATTPTAVRGLLVQDPRYGAADIAASQTAGGRPDQPTRTGTALSAAVLESLGTTDGTTRYVHVQRGGGITPTGAALWGWSTDGTSTTKRGAWSRLVASEMLHVSLTSAAYVRPVMAVSETGRLIIAVYNGTKILSKFVDTDDTTLDSYGLPFFGAGGDVTTSGTSKPAAMIVLPGNRIVLYVQAAQTYGTTTYQTLSYYYSDNDGTTWTLGRSDVGTRVDTGSWSVARWSACYHGGYVTVVAKGTTTEFASWTSSNGGTDFDAVDAAGALAIDNDCEIVACDDGSVLLLYAKTDTTGKLMMSRKRAPKAAFADDAAVGTIVDDSRDFASGQDYGLAACKDAEGTVAVLARLSGERRYRLVRVRQEVTGEADVISLVHPGDSGEAEPIYTGSGASGYFRIYSLVPWRDALWALVLDDDGASPFLSLVKFGGWSSVDWGTETTFGLQTSSITIGWWWAHPLDPAGCGWTATGAGTGSSSGLGGWGVACVGNTLSYQRAGSATGKPLVIMGRLRVASGGSLTGDDISIRLIRDTGAGSSRYDVSVRFDGTGIRLYDNNAAATLGTDASGLTSGDYVDVLVTLSSTKAAVRYKAPTSSYWTLGPQGTATAAATASGNVVRWGSLSTTTSTSHWAFVASAIDDRLDAPVMAEPTGFAPQYGREMSARPQWLQDGITVRARSGPLLEGETWSVGTVYDYGALDPVSRVAPDEEWRSTSDASEVTITWTLSSTANTFAGSTSFGVCLRGANFQDAYFEAYDGTTWTTLVTIDTATGMTALDFVRSGYVVVPSSSGVGDRYAQADEYAGGYAILSSGGTDYPVLIEGNTAGVWRGTSGLPQLILTLDRETSLGALPSSGTIALIPPLYVALRHAVLTAYRAFRVRIPAQDTVEGHFRLKRPPIQGPFLVFGRQYEWGRLIGTLLSQETTELRSGARRVKMLRRPRRYVEMAWTSMIVGGGAGGVWGASPNPDFVAISGGTSVALRRDPALLEGVLQVARGGQQPVVVLPRIATGSTTTQISARELIIPGRIVGEGGARTAVQGDEWSTEAATLGTIRVEEDP